MVTMDKIGTLIDHGHGLAVHCLNTRCRRYAELDMTALAARLGRDHGSMHADLAPLMKCSACGGKRVQMVLLAPTRPSSRQKM